MDKNIEISLLEILDTMKEALAHLEHTENEELRQMVKSGRQHLTEALESELDCSLDQRIDASALSDEDWLRTVYRIMGEVSDPFRLKNVFDAKFKKLLDHLWSHSKEELVAGMKAALNKLREQSVETYDGFVEYFSRFPLWGTFDPEKGDYNTLELRAEVLKQHSYDFLWLYRRLEDYHSRYTLCSILENWAFLALNELTKIRSVYPDYWEPDIFPQNAGDVLVDVGAFIGDSIQQYVQVYGTSYRKIYAYEISEKSYDELCRNVEAMKLHDVTVRRKGAGRTRGEMFVSDSETDLSANQLSQSGEAGRRVEVVPLDEDVEETMTFLKMDIEGAEQDALLGCERTIRAHHPKLAVCVYHGYEDIWKIPAMIDEMYPGYQFYLRHYGGNLIPTEFVLLCKP
ncbi:MAG: FkbM family methyltransferase [Oscillospiraceae bacterium]|nr:FkbM family methyltransferase [Oscillospiraceae bacterium]